MICYKDEILVCHRRDNIYTHISGFLEPVETAVQAVYREINEEIRVPRDKIKEVVPYTITQPWPSRYISLMLPYRVELTERAQFRPSEEIKDAKWIGKQEFREAADRADKDVKDVWVVPGSKAVARYMMESFFEK